MFNTKYTTIIRLPLNYLGTNDLKCQGMEVKTRSIFDILRNRNIDINTNRYFDTSKKSIYRSQKIDILYYRKVDSMSETTAVRLNHPAPSLARHLPGRKGRGRKS